MTESVTVPRPDAPNESTAGTFHDAEHAESPKRPVAHRRTKALPRAEARHGSAVGCEKPHDFRIAKHCRKVLDVADRAGPQGQAFGF